MDRFAKLPFAEKLKDTAGIIDAGKMVLFDVIIHLPVIYFPTYYTVKEFVSGQSWNPSDWVRISMTWFFWLEDCINFLLLRIFFSLTITQVMDGTLKYMKNAKDDLTAMIKLWGPSDCIQFVLPVHIRLPFRHLVSFFWTAYVSFTRGSIDDPSSSKKMEVEQNRWPRVIN